MLTILYKILRYEYPNLIFAFLYCDLTFFIIIMFSRYTEQLKCRKQEYPKLISNKQEEEIYLKEYVLILYTYYVNVKYH